MSLSKAELIDTLNELGVNKTLSEKIVLTLSQTLENNSPLEGWTNIQALLPPKPNHFKIHQLIYRYLFPEYHRLPAPAWRPNASEINASNLEKLRATVNATQDAITHYTDLFRWSLNHCPDFWKTMVETLNIIFDTPYTSIVNLDQGFESPDWFENGKMNIINSCFTTDPSATAIISQDASGQILKVTYGALDQLSNRIANSLIKKFKKKDAVAIIMPMTINAVAIYLGIIKAGLVAVSIADSFSADEIKIRLKIANTAAVFTQDVITRDGKTLPLYERIIQAEAPDTVVIAEQGALKLPLRLQDSEWTHFLSEETSFKAMSCDPSEPINILFSSGTTGDPKAIPWTHTTPIKSSVDAHLHHDLKRGDIFCWHTNLGWMMGPWLIFSTLINHATMALYPGTPNGKGFGQFVQDAKVTHLGVVPTLVKTWRTSGCMEELDWKAIKLFTSTGECSNPDDMLYLMYLAQYRPIIEYCGGTEIGGAYITGSILQASAPAAFTTPTLGLDFVILNEEGRISDSGEVALIPPSIGLSTQLLNKNHHDVYYAGLPEYQGRPLRRHGDEVSRYPNGFYRLHGRSDDTMNLGGIKVSSAEIERVLNTHPALFETAAIAIEPAGGGPSELVIYAVLKNLKDTQAEDTSAKLTAELQMQLKQHLNPLFKIYDLVIVPALPRTASNKVMRRVLRKEYQNQNAKASKDA